MGNEPGRLRHRLALALVAALLVGVGGVVGILANASTQTKERTVTATAAQAAQAASAPVDPHVAAGAHDFVQFACAQCHGDRGRGGVAPAVPALTSVAKALTPAELRSIIDHGLGESSNPTQPYMPVWGAVISKTQVSDLIAYLRAGLPAVPTAEPPTIPRAQGAAVEGGVLYVRYGCVNCHGPNGLGGVPNPQSPDKTIPPLSGQDFRKEFNTDAKIIAVIRSGSVIGKAPIVSMPHWGGIIPEDQLRALVAYITTLK
jgi:mono/diheme cytochrome c family protein